MYLQCREGPQNLNKTTLRKMIEDQMVLYKCMLSGTQKYRPSYLETGYTILFKNNTWRELLF